MNVYQVFSRVSKRKWEEVFSATNQETANQAAEHYKKTAHDGETEVRTLTVHEDGSYQEYLERTAEEQAAKREEEYQKVLRSLSKQERAILGLPDPEPTQSQAPQQEAAPQDVPEEGTTPEEGAPTQSAPAPVTPEVAAAPQPETSDFPW